MNCVELNTKIIYTNISHRNKVVGEQIHENYRLISEKILDNGNLALIFRPITFKSCEEPSREIKNRYRETRRLIEEMDK